MVDIEKKTTEVEEVVINNLTRKEFMHAAATASVDDKKLGPLVDGNPFLLLVIPVIVADIWSEIVRMKGETDGAKEN